MHKNKGKILLALVIVNTVLLSITFWIENTALGCDWSCQQQSGLLSSGDVALIGMLVSIFLGISLLQKSIFVKYVALALTVICCGLATFNLINQVDRLILLHIATTAIFYVTCGLWFILLTSRRPEPA